MTKTITALLFLAMLCGCGEKLDEKDTRETYGVETIDGCEYINFGYKWGYSHKGNCSNPVHCYCDTLEQKVDSTSLLISSSPEFDGDTIAFFDSEGNRIKYDTVLLKRIGVRFYVPSKEGESK